MHRVLEKKAGNDALRSKISSFHKVKKWRHKYIIQECDDQDGVKSRPRLWSWLALADLSIVTVNLETPMLLLLLLQHFPQT